MVAEHLLQRAGQLQAEQVYWEGVRRQTNAALQEHANREMQAADIARAMYTDNEQEHLRSQISNAVFRLQEISQELERIKQLELAEARETAQREQGQREEALKETPQREDALKEIAVREDREKAEAIQKEELLKAEAFEKERQEKEFFEKKEGERLEAIAKEEREKQEALEKEEREKQEAPQKDGQSELDFLGEQLIEVNQEWQYVQDQIASEWNYVDEQIQEEMEYNVGQALAAVAEAGFEIGMAIANPVSQKETGDFLKDQKQQLSDFISDEVFQAASSEHKRMWLEEKFKEQVRAEAEQFDQRKDDFGNREKLLAAMSELHKSNLEAVDREHQIETKLQADIEELKRVLAETKERLEKANLDKDILDEKIKQAEELAKKIEAQLRERAEQERQAIWEREQRLMQEIETLRREEAAREEARAREEAARVRRDTLGF